MAISVAIVDEDRELAAALTRELERRQYQVFTATSAQKALELLGQHRVDVLLTEIRTDTTDGLELLTALRAKSPETRAVLMSSQASAEDYKRALKLGAVELLTKPFNMQAMLSAVETAVDCDSGFRGSVHGITLVDVLQMLHFGRRSVSVHVGEDGVIHLRDGEIVHAQLGRERGKKALVPLLAADSGTVQTMPLETGEQTIVGSLDGLLLDTLRQVDEQKAGRAGGLQVDDNTLDELFGDEADWEAVTSRSFDSFDTQHPAPAVPSAPAVAGQSTAWTGSSSYPTGPSLPTVDGGQPFRPSSGDRVGQQTAAAYPASVGYEMTATDLPRRRRGVRRAILPLLVLLLASSAFAIYWLTRDEPTTGAAAVVGAQHAGEVPTAEAVAAPDQGVERPSPEPRAERPAVEPAPVPQPTRAQAPASAAPRRRRGSRPKRRTVVKDEPSVAKQSAGARGSDAPPASAAEGAGEESPVRDLPPPTKPVKRPQFETVDENVPAMETVD